jgi:aminoglycoside phosphotransferase family enzyme
MSFVFMAGDHVYKLKKPVHFSYLDFSTLEQRAGACRAEFSLNRRLAPNVYIGVVPLTGGGPLGFAIDGQGPILDWLVVMRRLDENANLEAALLDGRLTSAQVDRIAATLKTFYRQARRIYLLPETCLAEWWNALAYDKRVLLDLRFDLPRGRVRRIGGAQRNFLLQRAELLIERIRERRLVDAHGDLRPEHIFLGESPIVIDCLEFSPRLRTLDPLDEIAFLDLECERLGAKWVGGRIKRRLAYELDDDPASGLFLFYRSRRAMLRARLAIAHLLDAKPRTPEQWPRRARDYLRLAAADAARLERLLRTQGDP